MPNILHQLTIQAEPEKVYRALTEQDGLARWWTRDTRAEPKIGSTALFGFADRSTIFEMEVTELNPGHRVEWRCRGGHPEWENTRLSFDLSPTEKGCRLLFTHRGWEGDDGILPLCSFEWARYLISLKNYLETGQGAPHTG